LALAQSSTQISFVGFYRAVAALAPERPAQPVISTLDQASER
jgi:hypothetical protein